MPLNRPSASMDMGHIYRWCSLHSVAVQSAYVDKANFDGIVPVAEAIPGRDVGLHIAGGIGRAGTKRMSSHLGWRPLKRPVLPLVWSVRAEQSSAPETTHLRR